MTNEVISISPKTQTMLLELAARLGKPASELLDRAVEEFGRRSAIVPITEIPGVDPAELWESAAEAEAGKLTPHDEVFAKLRKRQ